MAKRGNNGRFEKSAAKPAQNKLVKVTVSGQFEGAKPQVHETYLTGSELDVFKIRMRNIYAAEFGLDPAYVEVK